MNYKRHLAFLCHKLFSLITFRVYFLCISTFSLIQRCMWTLAVCLTVTKSQIHNTSTTSILFFSCYEPIWNWNRLLHLLFHRSKCPLTKKESKRDTKKMKSHLSWLYKGLFLCETCWHVTLKEVQIIKYSMAKSLLIA